MNTSFRNDPEAIKAIKLSIQHWRSRILYNLVRGYKIDKYDMMFVDAQGDPVGPVQLEGTSCDLCRRYATDLSDGCKECPYTIYYGHSCDKAKEGHWWKFASSPNLKNGDAMLKALLKLLKD